jgi:hypothetical protein
MTDALREGERIDGTMSRHNEVFIAGTVIRVRPAARIHPATARAHRKSAPR